MKIVSLPYRMGSFCAKQKELDKDKNPVSKLGEREVLFKATVLAGVGFGAKMLMYLWEEGFAVDNLLDLGEKIAKKNKKKGAIASLTAATAVIAGFVGVMAILYTIFKTPDVMYNGKINAFKKGKDMDLYAKSNKVERELYDQMNDKARAATEEEKAVLKQQYLKLKAAKNPTPDFVETNDMPSV